MNTLEEKNNDAFEVEFDEAALRDLKKLTKQVQAQVIEAIEALTSNPRPSGVEPVLEVKGLFRIRTGNYRIVYMIEDAKLIVTVVAIGDRKLIYDMVTRRYA